MGQENLFQSYGTQNQYSFDNQNWGFQNNPYYNGGFIRRTQSPAISPTNIPVRVVFSPEQIAPQEIPTNGTPALFPLSDGSKIIARSLAGNGLFEERVYVLQPPFQPENEKKQPIGLDQVMERLGSIENSLNQVLRDLYGSKPQPNPEGGTTNGEQN